MKGQRKFKLDDTGQGIEKTVWLCPAAAGKMGMWYRVQSDYWGSTQNTPWYKMGIHADSCRIYVSYVVNDDVTSTTRRRLGPGVAGQSPAAEQNGLLRRGMLQPRSTRGGIGLGTTPTATHPSGEPRGSDRAGTRAIRQQPVGHPDPPQQRLQFPVCRLPRAVQHLGTGLRPMDGAVDPAARWSAQTRKAV